VLKADDAGRTVPADSRALAQRCPVFVEHPVVGFLIVGELLV